MYLLGYDEPRTNVSNIHSVLRNAWNFVFFLYVHFVLSHPHGCAYIDHFHADRWQNEAGWDFFTLLLTPHEQLNRKALARITVNIYYCRFVLNSIGFEWMTLRSIIMTRHIIIIIMIMISVIPWLYILMMAIIYDFIWRWLVSVLSRVAPAAITIYSTVYSSSKNIIIIRFLALVSMPRHRIRPILSWYGITLILTSVKHGNKIPRISFFLCLYCCFKYISIYCDSHILSSLGLNMGK